MADSNLIDVNKYIPKLPNSKDGSGYNSDYKQVIEPSFINAQAVVDYDTDAFKYGLDYRSGDPNNSTGWNADPMHLFEDPLLPIFDIILDTKNSPLFITDDTATRLNNVGIQSKSYTNSLAKFLDDYNNIYSIHIRKAIHTEFLKTLFTLFNTEFNQVQNNKSYYINSIDGLKDITKKMVEFEKDKITITLNEDVSMVSSYLASLYRNLAYSYKDQRQMIPANLLRFNMYIKIADVRNMLFYIPAGTGTTTSYDKSYQIFVLKDCTFNFFDSKSFDDTLTVGGYDAAKPDKPASLKFDVFYKSIEIESENPLIMDSLTEGSSAYKLNNKNKDLLSFKDGLNTVFMNNYKTPDAFDTELTNNAKYNNDKDNLINNNGFVNGVSEGTNNDHEKFFGKVSSDTESSNREDDLYEVPVRNTNNKGDVVYTSDTQDKRDKMINDTTIVRLGSSIYGDVIPFIDDVTGQVSLIEYNTVNSWDNIMDKRAEKIEDAERSYIPSVSNSDWNYAAYTTSDLINQNTNVLNQINNNFLAQLAANRLLNFSLGIVNDIFKNLSGKGAPPLYINTFAPDIPYPEDWKIDTEHKDRISVDDINVNDTPQIHPPIDKEYIDLYLKPKIDLSGNIDLYLKPKIDLSGKINLDYKEQIPLSGKINLDYKEQIPLDDEINMVYKIQPKLNANIDTSFVPKDQIDIVYVSTIGDPRLQFNTIYVTTPPDPRIIENMGYKYQNTFNPRTIDLGVLYAGINHSNLLPLLYLFTKTTKFNDLNNYSVYNNAISANKKLNNLYVDETLKNINPFDLIYSYDNNIMDVEKILNNIVSYNNNVNKNNNIEFERIYNGIPEKTAFVPISLYNNITETRKGLVLDYLYPKNDTEKIIPNIVLYDKINSKNQIEKDYVYDDSLIKEHLVKLGNLISISEENKKILNMGKISTTTKTKDLLIPNILFKPKEKIKVDLKTLYENTNNIRKNKLESQNLNENEVNKPKIKIDEINVIKEIPVEKNIFNEKDHLVNYAVEETMIKPKNLGNVYDDDKIIEIELNKEKILNQINSDVNDIPKEIRKEINSLNINNSIEKEKEKLEGERLI